MCKIQDPDTKPWLKYTITNWWQILESVASGRTDESSSSVLELVSRLDADAAAAAEGAQRVVSGAPLNLVPLPGLLPEEEDGDAGENAREETA